MVVVFRHYLNGASPRLPTTVVQKSPHRHILHQPLGPESHRSAATARFRSRASLPNVRDGQRNCAHIERHQSHPERALGAGRKAVTRTLRHTTNHQFSGKSPHSGPPSFFPVPRSALTHTHTHTEYGTAIDEALDLLFIIMDGGTAFRTVTSIAETKDSKRISTASHCPRECSCDASHAQGSTERSRSRRG